MSVAFEGELLVASGLDIRSKVVMHGVCVFFFFFQPRTTNTIISCTNATKEKLNLLLDGLKCAQVKRTCCLGSNSAVVVLLCVNV